MTNKSADWVSWESGLSTEENHHLIVPEDLRTAEEHVTKFRLCFGTVGGDFKKIKPPTYMTCVSQEAEGVLLNEIELTAQRNGKKWKDKDRTETILYRNGLSGYESEGGGNPLYEVVDVPQDTAEGGTSILQRAMNEAGRTGTGGLERLEDEGVPMGRYGKGGGIRTGDDAPFMFLTCLALTTGAGIVICLWRKRKKEYR